jgi:hypothetical protein
MAITKCGKCEASTDQGVFENSIPADLAFKSLRTREAATG